MEEAIRILTEAGYTWDSPPAWNTDRGGSVDWGQGLKLPDGSAFPELELLAPSAGYDPLRATAGVYIEQWMQSLGIPVEAQLTNFNNILTAVYDTGEFDIFILGWGLSLYPDYVCDFFYTGSGFNSPNYSNPDFDAMCDEFYAEVDLERARELNFQLQEILATELPYIYLFTTPMYDAYNNDALIFPVHRCAGRRWLRLLWFAGDRPGGPVTFWSSLRHEVGGSGSPLPPTFLRLGS